MKKRETLQIIAKRYLGSTGKWRQIQDANPGVDPKKLTIGLKLKIPRNVAQASKGPSSKSSPPREKQAPSTYVVKSRDTLEGIAKRFYGKAHKWRKILSANKRVIADPDRLRIGTRLTIPHL